MLTLLQFDVHAFLFSDMLLLCKNLSKRGHSSSDTKVKVIRQPFLIDRIRMADPNHESAEDNNAVANATYLAVVYLNEFNVVSSAFTLHSSESKVIRVSTERRRMHSEWIPLSLFLSFMAAATKNEGRWR